jgi:hypothetical protein
VTRQRSWSSSIAIHKPRRAPALRTPILGCGPRRVHPEAAASSPRTRKKPPHSISSAPSQSARGTRSAARTRRATSPKARPRPKMPSQRPSRTSQTRHSDARRAAHDEKRVARSSTIPTTRSTKSLTSPALRPRPPPRPPLTSIRLGLPPCPCVCAETPSRASSLSRETPTLWRAPTPTPLYPSGASTATRFRTTSRRSHATPPTHSIAPSPSLLPMPSLMRRTSRRPRSRMARRFVATSCVLPLASV